MNIFRKENSTRIKLASLRPGRIGSPTVASSSDVPFNSRDAMLADWSSEGRWSCKANNCNCVNRRTLAGSEGKSNKHTKKRKHQDALNALNTTKHKQHTGLAETRHRSQWRGSAVAAGNTTDRTTCVPEFLRL